MVVLAAEADAMTGTWVSSAAEGNMWPGALVSPAATGRWSRAFSRAWIIAGGTGPELSRASINDWRRDPIPDVEGAAKVRPRLYMISVGT